MITWERSVRERLASGVDLLEIEIDYQKVTTEDFQIDSMGGCSWTEDWTHNRCTYEKEISVVHRARKQVKEWAMLAFYEVIEDRPESLVLRLLPMERR